VTPRNHRRNARARRPLAAAALLTTAALLTACGARVDDDLRQAAADEALGRGGSGSTGASATGTDGSTGGDLSTGTTTGGSGTGGSGAVGGGVSGTNTASSGTTSGSGTGGGSAGAPAPAGGNGGAVDKGVTATSMRLGIVADLSGPVPGLFEGAVIGTQAYLAKVNSEGGVFGRQLQLDIGDGQLECGQNKAEHQKRLSSVFAFVGSFSLFDACGAEVLKANPGVPDVHTALSFAAQDLPNNFSVAPLGKGWRTGPLDYYKKKYGDAFSSIGAVYAGVGTGPAIWQGTTAAIRARGGDIAYERAFQATDTDFTADIVGMRRDGTQMIYINASDAATAYRVTNAAKQQGVDWPIIFGAIAYDAAFLKGAGANAEGVFNDQQFALFFNEDEAARIPAVKDFQTWTSRVAPGKVKNLFAVYGWASAQLFVESLKKAGPKATRADVLRELRKVTRFDAGQLLAPANPAGKKPATCWILTVVKGGKFQRVDTPATGYRCDGTYFTP
jgi:ABC-type branched-subunit amino acid transport system substrate-binding protein